MTELFEREEPLGQGGPPSSGRHSQWLRAALTAGLAMAPFAPFAGFVLFLAFKLGGALPLAWEVEDIREFDQ